MKKKVIVSLILILSLFFIPNVESADKIVIKYAFTANPGSPHEAGGLFFKKRAEDLTGGKVEVQLYMGTLGSKLETLEGLRMATIEMTSVSAPDLNRYSIQWSMFSLPYLFGDREHMWRALKQSGARKILEEDAEKFGFKLIGFWGMGVRSVINSKRIVTKPDDLKGLKIRVMQDPILAESMNAMGAIGVPMGWTEVYSALQQKVLDGIEQSTPLIVDSKAYEICKYYSLTEHFRMPDAELFSLKTFNSLPEDIQTAIIKAGVEAEAEYDKIWDKYETKCTEEIKKAGVKFNEVDKEIFRKSVQPIYEKFGPKIGMDLINKVRSVK